MTIADKFDLIVLDLHNTIFDEVMEYGLSIDAAISEILKTNPVSREQLYLELSEEHKKLGSDWDDDVWANLPSLKNAPQNVIDKAIELRHSKSKELTLSGVYDYAVETLSDLKNQGKRIYIVSEAAADIGMQVVEWLKLPVDGVYTYPSRKKPKAIKNVFHKPFTNHGTTHLVKPNALLLAQVAFDDAKTGGLIANDAALDDFVGLESDNKLALAEFDIGNAIQKDISARLVIKNAVIKNVLDKMLFVGDSKFKDGIMARNAGVKFALAAYGKDIKKGEEAKFKKSKDILYAVTGWDKETLKLTQEASKSKMIHELKPDYILHKITDLVQP